MPEFQLAIAAIEYGGYISIIKLIVFLVLFFPLLPLISWVYNDAESLEEKSAFWAGIIFGTAAVTILIWLVVPIFIIGAALYSVSVAAAGLAYVKMRNSKVIESDRVLTAEHIRGLLSGIKEKKAKIQKTMLFITANKNEVPVPEPKTPDSFGYKTAIDIFTDALWRRTENILFLPAQQAYNVVYNIDGVPSKQQPIPKDQMEYFIHFAKQLGDLDINEKRKPQKSFFKTRLEKDDYEWEIITAGSTAGEQIQINRRASKDLKKIDDLNLSSDQIQQILNVRNIKQGVFIISGPRKSGVTTTFYALLRIHDAFLNNISTLETEPSAVLPNITQEIYALSDTGITTYNQKLETMIRMGPDIAGVTNCNDGETAQLLCKAARDNKLIYLTMESDSALNALAKWIKLVGNQDLAIDVLIGISNQRLVRVLCEECKQAYVPDKELLRKFNLPADKVKAFYRPGKIIYDKHGKPQTCENCQGTGFVGRTAIFESIMMNDDLKNSIKELKSLAEISRQFRNAKMLFLQEQTLKKVIAGTTAINEMVRVFSKPKQNNEAKTS
jgi:type II secretory ATPase GspE/PulE/Tfp pilus assembly ATPase PilB-like protein